MFHELKTAMLVLLLSASGHAIAQDEQQLGHTTFPNSGAEAAQTAFMRGLLLLHSFEYEDAREAFVAARKTDPGFAMAYWGEAMTYYRMLWNEVDLDGARAALQRLAPEAAERQAKAGTQRERDYLASLETLFGEGDSTKRAQAYAEAMRNLSNDYPDDENAAAFYALALLGSSGVERDFSIYMKSAAVSESIMAKNPQHPGAVHYLIHAYDDPIHAPLGLRPALKYAEIAPAATHPLHMPSHIFFPLGMWREASEINARSYEAGKAWSKRHDEPLNGGAGHALTWLVYSLMQEGRQQEARNHLLDFRRIAESHPPRLGQFIETWAAYLVETDYQDAEFLSFQTDDSKLSPRHASLFNYTRAVIAARAGDLENFTQHQQKLALVEMESNDLNWSDKGKDVMLFELEAIENSQQSKLDEALQAIVRAVAIEQSMPLRYGPPWPPKPSHELYGELLLNANRPADAGQQFTKALSLAEGRSISLLGLARAAGAQNKTSESRRAYNQLLSNWREADSGFPGVQEARQATRDK